MEPENIALIELGGSHDECLFSQVLFLKEKPYRVHILLFSDHLSRMAAWPEVDCWRDWASPSGFFGEWILVFRVLTYLRRNKIRRAVINTAEGNIIRKLARASGKNMDYTGIIHLARKLWTSRSQRIISRKIRKYLVLAGFIADNLERAYPSLSLEYFYPVYFPALTPSRPGSIKEAKGTGGQEGFGETPGPGTHDQERSGAAGTESIGTRIQVKSNGDFLVCVPGAVDYARRDYGSLLDELKTEGIPENMRFMLLGRTTGPDGMDLLSRIRKEGMEEFFITFTDFIDPGHFYAYLSLSDLILPLITPDSGDFADYQKYKITGAYNLAWGFQIPMLMHESFKGYPIFSNTSVFYRTGEMLRELKRLAGRREELDDLRKRIQVLEDFDRNRQTEKYLDFITR
jgi:hypothetical protein